MLILTYPRMSIIRTIVTSNIIGLILGFGPGSANAQIEIEIPPTKTSCALSGWTNNNFGGDIPVRNTPSPMAPIVGHLPLTIDNEFTNPDGDRLYSVYFNIVGSENGWLRIDQISDSYNQEMVDPARTADLKEGWVPSTAVSFKIQSARGFVAPNDASRKIIDLGHDWVTDLGEIEHVLGCSGKWVLVDFVIKLKRDSDGRLVEFGELERPHHRAWFRGVCGVEETTCDSASVDVDP